MIRIQEKEWSSGQNHQATVDEGADARIGPLCMDG